MRDYGTFSDAARLAGYDEEQTAKLTSSDNALSKKDFISYFRKTRISIYICSLSCILSIAALVNFIFVEHSLLFTAAFFSFCFSVSDFCGQI